MGKVAWYGGGPTLPRKAINTGFSQTDLAIEVYPLRLQLLLMPKGERDVIRISKKDTVGELHKKACEVFDLIPDEVCIWDYYGRTKHALMDNLEKTLDDANIQMDQDILVEITTDANGSLDGGCMSSIQESEFFERGSTSLVADASKSELSKELASNNYASRSYGSSLTQNLLRSSNGDLDNMHGTSGMTRRGSPLGLTGLINLGNTCYMNSAIQCLVHTPEFARYFCEDYHREINWQNPLGMVGELALAFGELLRKLWAPSRAPVSPRPFKLKLSRFASQFSGNNQHDSQELLAFLLDGLHEDLNRVKHRPYIRSKDADGRSDEEVADEYWANHIARNNSIIVDVCQGQYKSTLVCPVCGKVSVTFDPFMYLSLPLQFASTRSMTVVVFSCDGSAPPTPFTVSVPKQGRCRDLFHALSNSCSLRNGERLLIAEIRNHRIYRFLEDPVLQLSTVNDDDHLAVYRLPKLEKRANYIQFVHRREDLDHGHNSSLTSWRPYGIPLLAQISRNETVTGNDIHEFVRKMLVPMLRNQDTQHSAVQSSVSTRMQSYHTDSSKFQLNLVDDSGTVIEKSDDAIRVPQSSLATVVFVNWSKADLKKIDAHHFENLPEVFKFAPPAKRTRGEPLSLYSCLDAFLREEPLVPEDMWYCPRCKEQRQASKKLDLWRLPEVLVIHLKRFSFSRSTKHKLETFVNFPIHNLDLTHYIANKKSSHRQIYELYAVSNHYGSMASGHYTAFIKLLAENRWYNFDDSQVSAMNEEDVKSGAAYVLFYRRVREQDEADSNGAQPSVSRNHRSSQR
ncbi:ubiquitin carboxyl-terminal hydrolase 5-like isoform X2 [Phragmites australis]|uniref:ubiquitin carboxyl-terminal hydrolase 5-like isoform X2 n=1 Tax=Phragmites australis TaxID=29695 RepID=UPI002D77A14D|nr:ubiquitin carboxyl-terminal hydrolase 5-like isoform X2 [Phragmites australis]